MTIEVKFINRGDADLSTLVWEKLGTSLDSGLKDKVRWQFLTPNHNNPQTKYLVIFNTKMKNANEPTRAATPRNPSSEKPIVGSLAFIFFGTEQKRTS